MLTYRFDHGRRLLTCPTSLALRNCGNNSTAERKRQAADAFWRDENAAQRTGGGDRPDCAAHQVPPQERDHDAGGEEDRRYLLSMPAVSEMLAARLLVAYHLAHQRR